VSVPRFLVDENLSVLLPQTAHARGYEATHINHYGLQQAKDWDILKIVADEDWTLVTNNAFEFRGRYQRLEIHPGVVFLLPAVPRLRQIELFSAALDVIGRTPDMLNIALDVTYVGNDIQVNRYTLPK
jgi:predicted nuclease of predicted toxin-antitoxin system